jgi:hypothetical protein
MNKKINPDKYLRLNNGIIIKSISELPVAISQMNNSTFLSYVDIHKNDFSKWIYEAFNEVELSSLLGNIKSKNDTIRLVIIFERYNYTST